SGEHRRAARRAAARRGCRPADHPASRSRATGGSELMYLLDTNVISEVRKARAGKADQNVAAWAAAVPVADLFVSVIAIQEIEIGVLLAERRDPRQGRL